jgi:hypothetical protein
MLPSILCPSKNNPIAISDRTTPFMTFPCEPKRLSKINAIPVM